MGKKWIDDYINWTILNKLGVQLQTFCTEQKQPTLLFFQWEYGRRGVILSQKGKKKNQELEKPESQIKPQHTVEPTIHTIPSQY